MALSGQISPMSCPLFTSTQLYMIWRMLLTSGTMMGHCETDFHRLVLGSSLLNSFAPMLTVVCATCRQQSTTMPMAETFK